MKKVAVAVLNEGGVKGVVTFSQLNSRSLVKITGTFEGLSHGEHGINIYEFGDLRSIGKHFNPWNTKHGSQKKPVNERHVGDLGNVVVEKDGTGKFDIIDSVITLFGANSIIGRTFAIHSKGDDLGLGKNEESSISGNSGDVIALGVIGIGNG